jgi:hypothetical protein
MARKACFGSIKEVMVGDGMAMTQTRPECEDCPDFRECLFHVRIKDDEEKQDLIAKIIDHSEVVSNELGSCLLEFLNRMYSSAVGISIFNDLLLFYEVPPHTSSVTVRVPIPRTLIESAQPARPKATVAEVLSNPSQAEGSDAWVTLQLILLQRSFPNNRKANLGLIAHEVASLFASSDSGIRQIMQVISEQEARVFRKMDVRLRTNWLVEKWGFQAEHEAFRNEVAQLGAEHRKWNV